MIYKGDVYSWDRWMELRPEYVSKDFSCGGNKLTSLVGGPEYVGGNYYCSHNKLTSLEGLPKHVGGNIYCSHNKLKNDKASVFDILKYGDKIVISPYAEVW